MSTILKDKFTNLTVIVPSIAASSLAYIALRGNNILMTEKSRLTQFDMLAPWKGKLIRPSKNLKDKDPAFNAFSHMIHGRSYEIIEYLFKKSPFIKRKIKVPNLSQLMIKGMLQKEHEHVITCYDLLKINLPITIITEKQKKEYAWDEIIKFLSLTIRGLDANDLRFIFETIDYQKKG